MNTNIMIKYKKPSDIRNRELSKWIVRYSLPKKQELEDFIKATSDAREIKRA
jgi:hypothetical protein